MEMGFNREAARQALLDNNNNLEVALNFLLTRTNQPKAAETEQSRPPPRGKPSDRCQICNCSRKQTVDVRRAGLCWLLKHKVLT